MKYCWACKNMKKLDLFGKNKSKPDGLSCECKDCKKIQDKNYYLKNSKKVKEKVSEYRKNNCEKIKISKKNSYLKKPEKYKNLHNAWKKNNYKKTYFYNKIYKSKNLGKAASWCANYRAIKKKAIPPWFEKELVETVYKKAKEWGFAVDHIVPLKSDIVCGLHCWSNLQLLDPILNSSKSNKYWVDMP